MKGCLPTLQGTSCPFVALLDPPHSAILPACSTTVGPRRPFGRDPSLDYDVASDDEWEEEPEGESLSDSGDEDSMATKQQAAGEGRGAFNAGWMSTSTHQQFGCLHGAASAVHEGTCTSGSLRPQFSVCWPAKAAGIPIPLPKKTMRATSTFCTM